MPVPGSELRRQEKSYRLVGKEGFPSAVLMVDMLQVSAERVLYVVWKDVPKSIST